MMEQLRFKLFFFAVFIVIVWLFIATISSNDPDNTIITEEDEKNNSKVSEETESEIDGNDALEKESSLKDILEKTVSEYVDKDETVKDDYTKEDNEDNSESTGNRFTDYEKNAAQKLEEDRVNILKEFEQNSLNALREGFNSNKEDEDIREEEPRKVEEEIIRQISITEVTSGNTLKAKIGGEERSIKLIGIQNTINSKDMLEHVFDNLDYLYIEFDNQLKDTNDNFLVYLWMAEPSDNYNHMINSIIIETESSNYEEHPVNKKYHNVFVGKSS